MLYTPNKTSWGDTYASFPNRDHPCLLTNGWVDAALEVWEPGITGDYDAPPPSIIDCHYAKEWTMDCSLTGFGIALTRSELIWAGGAVDWMNSTGAYWLVNYDEDEYEEYGPGNIYDRSIRIVITMTRDLEFSWGDGKWWPDLALSLIHI